MAETVCKTLRQYSSGAIPEADRKKLEEIAEDYCRVKNYVYQRYGGVGSLPILYPGYTVQNQMTGSGLRERLGLPSVYFYCAVFDALGDIRAWWSRVKTGIQEAAAKNPGFSPEDLHYLRFALKVNNCFAAILNHTEPELPEGIGEKYRGLAGSVDAVKLDGYIRRQARKRQKKLNTDRAEGFSMTERAYRYGDHGIYIATKEKRKRVFIPLTDGNSYKRQLYVRVPEPEGRVEILVPAQVRIKSHEDYRNETGLSMGMQVMLTTDGGRAYGERLGEVSFRNAEWIREQTKSYRKNRKDNPGRKKYREQKRRREERLHAYINEELNRFLREEKPERVYLPKLQGKGKAGKVKKYNYYASMWQKGYIRKRLEIKCREHSVELVEVFGKDISAECSRCGAIGKKEGGMFYCPACGREEEEKTNAAQNAKKRGRRGRHVEGGEPEESS